MYLNQFSVRVVGGHEDAGGYVEMNHGQQYSLSLHNDRSERCDASVEIDSKHVGTWRIEPRSSITIERSAHDPGKFTFYRLGSMEASQAAIDGRDPNLGLVKVTFTPEVRRQPLYRTIYDQPVTKGLTTDCMTRSAGGTGLSGHSGQQFYDAGHIDYDSSQETVIHLRLVCRDSGGNYGPRPLTSTSSPVPPRVW